MKPYITNIKCLEYCFDLNYIQDKPCNCTKSELGHVWKDCWIEQENNDYQKHSFSNLFELDGISFEEPTANFFAFNNPIGACKTCEGFGSIIGIDPELVIPNKSLSVFENAIAISF